jgi:phospho-N-acetylmuramoyl-pentapeptide-transferase
MDKDIVPKEENMNHAMIAFFGILFAFAATCLAIAGLNRYLPKDMGREYAHDGTLSAGKPRGAGIIFVLVFVVSAVLFGQINLEIAFYLALVVIEMLTGFFDDASDHPWGEYLKGFLDLAVAIVTALVFLHYNSSTVRLAVFGIDFSIPPVVFGILTVVLVWASINVTNCSDGVDGLSGTLSIITLMTVFVLDNLLGVDDSFNFSILLFCVCLLGYLWYNATPSKLLMGDAGSRAMGIFIAIAMLKLGSPFLYLLVAAVLIVDGGLGLIKVSLLRFLKIHILKNVTTPLHDHVRKKLGWSNAQVVFRFAIIQIVISLATVYLVMI